MRIHNFIKKFLGFNTRKADNLIKEKFSPLQALEALRVVRG
jgi:hypothetical protein